ncbi:MAG: hypothetical protein GF398_09220 [Chitinivibrionales bacterium]|nr:hypothetical protein [Chitinivibrionales bacterium]
MVFVVSIVYALKKNKYLALRLIHLIHFIIHIGIGYAVYRIAKHLDHSSSAFLAAGIAMVSYQFLKYSANGLETELYLLFIIACSHYYIETVLTSKNLLHHCCFGEALGLLILTRIDGRFLCIAFGLHYLLYHIKRTAFDIKIMFRSRQPGIFRTADTRSRV